MTLHVLHTWGTAITIDVRQHCSLELVEGVDRWFEWVDEVFSTWRADSQINRYERGELTLQNCSPELREVLALSDAVTVETRGAFDIRVAADPRVQQRPGFAPLDPSGIVNGWALARAAAWLRDQDVDRVAISAGGDVVVGAAPSDAAGWTVGIQHPHVRAAVAATITCAHTGIATSGRYELGDHIIDPRTGAPATRLLAATVVCDDFARADAYATAAIVMGDEAMAWLTEEVGVAALVITNDRQVITNGAFARLRVDTS